VTAADVVSVQAGPHRCPNVMWVTVPNLPVASPKMGITDGSKAA
jgi:hypothetical protein